MTDDLWTPPADVASQADALLAEDALHRSDVVKNFFGDRYDAVGAFAELLAAEGETRGLLGPREYGRLWERHILNSAAVVPFLGEEGSIADVGSGAGLPGVVIAAMLPERHVILIEPMERRVQWLEDASRAVGLTNVEVIRGRAEEVGIVAEYVTARAVAAVDKLVKWCAPLLSDTGTMAFLKGRSAHDEIDRAKYALKKARLVADVVQAPTIEGIESTTVVRLRQASAS